MCAAVLAIAVRIMTLTHVLAALLLVLLISAPPVAADSVPDTGQPHVRITDRHLRTLFAEGVRSSPTLRALVSRLDASDVVVYVQPDPYASPGFAGRLTLLSVVGDIRYVLVRVAPLSSAVQELGMVGHELQHAVEVAEKPEIVDASSMYREYMRMGYVSGSTGSGLVFDTRAAIEVGELVSQELRSASSLSGGHADVTPVGVSRSD